MADTFMRSGLNIETLKTARKYFGGAENTRCGPTAQLYSELEEGGLPPNAVRLIVLPVADAPEISSFGVPSLRAPPLPLSTQQSLQLACSSTLLALPGLCLCVQCQVP